MNLAINDTVMGDKETKDLKGSVDILVSGSTIVDGNDSNVFTQIDLENLSLEINCMSCPEITTVGYGKKSSPDTHYGRCKDCEYR